MKQDIIFAGVGGQGIVSVAAMLVEAAGKKGLNAKQNEVHGMAQRGGAVSCHVRISDKPIWSDIIPKGSADFILATEPMEAIRYTDYLVPEKGTVITSNQPVKNIPYPDEKTIMNEVLKHRCVIMDTQAIAGDLHNPKVGNIAVLGALIKQMGILKEEVEVLIRKKFSSKGEKVVETNLKAFQIGLNS